MCKLPKNNSKIVIIFAVYILIKHIFVNFLMKFHHHIGSHPKRDLALKWQQVFRTRGFFLFLQFCDVAEVAIIHKMI